MVDWDRVEMLRSRGWSWERIAEDPRVGFHPDAALHDPGAALRGLYQRERSRSHRRPSSTETLPPARRTREDRTARWTLARLGYLLTPALGVWFSAAFLVPSPVGLVLPAIPYLALALAGAAFLLVFGLWRSPGRRWSKGLRTTVVLGVVLGLVVAGLIAAGGALVFGCPYLPSAASATHQPSGWTSVGAAPWQDGGKPVVYYYGATWCPYCSASSWAIWKALGSFDPTALGSVPPTAYSAEDGIPEVVLADLSFPSAPIAFQASEEVSSTVGAFPSASNCVQAAYVNAYAASSIPFLVVNGQYVHGGSSLVPASALASWANGANNGTAAVLYSVVHETGAPWQGLADATWWTMAFIVKSLGGGVAPYAATYHWSSATTSAVTSDLAALH